MSNLQEEIINEAYSEISKSKLVESIRKHHPKVKITNTLIESLLDLAKSKELTNLAVVNDLRHLNHLSFIIPGKIDYKLNNGTVVAIDESTQEAIQTLSDNIISEMKTNKETFLSVVKCILETSNL